MFQNVKEIAVKPVRMNSTPETHMVGGKHTIPSSVL